MDSWVDFMPNFRGRINVDGCSLIDIADVMHLIPWIYPVWETLKRHSLEKITQILCIKNGKCVLK